MKFIVCKQVADLGVRSMGVIMEHIDNQTITPAYEQYRRQSIERLLQKYEGEDWKKDARMEGFYKLHETVHVKRRKNPPSMETLIRMLQKRGDIPHINKAVDIYNILSVETMLALGAHDIDRINGNVTLRLTTGKECFVPLGQTERKPVQRGVYSYVDDGNDVICSLEIRQGNKTIVTPSSTSLFFIIQGNAATPWEEIQQTAELLLQRITQFCGGSGYICK